MRVGISILCNMLRILAFALRWMALPFLALIAQAMFIGLWHDARLHGFGIGIFWHPLTLFWAGGIAFRIGFRALMNRLKKHDPLEFIDTLEHELTHALFGYLTFSPPVSLTASLKSGGEVELKGSNIIIALAPYFFPLWTFISLLIGFLVQTGLQSTWNHGTFFLLGIFTYRLAREYRWRQTDLHLYGFFFSTICTALFLMLSLGFILAARGILSLGWILESGRIFMHNLAGFSHRIFPPQGN